ncbi:Lipoprotein-releasing system ATP-binding protein lolD [Bacillus thuringiensis IBL 4222]|nr:Lipoprotein-releasing system ATP-binding protein lolD [Bacillus thuringiensis IBL 4222]
MAFAQTQDAITTAGKLDVVRDDDEAGAKRTRQFQHQLEDFTGGVVVQVASGLVGQHAGG